VLDKEISKKKIDGLTFGVDLNNPFRFYINMNYTELIFSCRDESVEFVDVICIHSDLIEKIKINVLRFRLTAKLHLLVFNPTHLQIKLQL
jgi:hypothetical protein